MTDKKKKRVGVLAILLLFQLLGGVFFIYTQERPELFIPKEEIITRAEIIKMLVRISGRDEETENTKDHSE